jgi:SRSO17 transposase
MAAPTDRPSRVPRIAAFGAVQASTINDTGVVLAYIAYGNNSRFRNGASALALLYVVGVRSTATTKAPAPSSGPRAWVHQKHLKPCFALE